VCLRASRRCRQKLPPPRSAPADTQKNNNAPLLLRTHSYVANLNATYGLPSFVEFYVGEGGLPAAYLLHPRGHTAEVYLHGATVTRWLDDAGANLLFLRPDAVFDGVAPIK
jgi:glucose-6-phosphate 1-epimerase